MPATIRSDISLQATMAGILAAFVGFGSSFAVILRGVVAAGATPLRRHRVCSRSLSSRVSAAFCSASERACRSLSPGRRRRRPAGERAAGAWRLRLRRRRLSRVWVAHHSRRSVAGDEPCCRCHSAIACQRHAGRNRLRSLPCTRAGAAGKARFYHTHPCGLGGRRAAQASTCRAGGGGGRGWPRGARPAWRDGAVPQATTRLGDATFLVIRDREPRRAAVCRHHGGAERPRLRGAEHERVPSSSRDASWGDGLASIVVAPFGAIPINLAAITAAMCASHEAHPDPRRRWWASAVAGGVYVVIGLFSGLITTFIALSSPVLITAVAGIALFGALAVRLRVPRPSLRSAMRR